MKDVWCMKYFNKSWDLYLSRMDDARQLMQPPKLFQTAEMFALCPVDVLVGSPACKAFSSLAIRKKDRKETAENTPQDLEFVRFLDFVRITKPKVFVLENLRKVFDYIQFDGQTNNVVTITGDALVNLSDYHVTIFPDINTTDYGVPQSRRRMFWIGVRADIGCHVPNIHQVENRQVEPRTARWALENLDPDLPNQEVSKHSQERIDGFARLKPGQSYYGTQNNKRIHLDRPGPTITSHRTQYVHPTEPRVLTVRECARIMGYPDSFEFFGPRTKQYDQVGCGISPRLAQVIATHIRNELEL